MNVQTITKTDSMTTDQGPPQTHKNTGRSIPHCREMGDRDSQPEFRRRMSGPSTQETLSPICMSDLTPDSDQGQLPPLTRRLRPRAPHIIRLRFFRPLDKIGLIEFRGWKAQQNQELRDRADLGVALYSAGGG